MEINNNTLWREICSLVEDKNPTKPTLGLQKNLMNVYNQVWNENPEIQDGNRTTTFRDRMNQVGSHIGVNTSAQTNNSNLPNKQNTNDRDFVINFIDKMVSAGIELRKYVTEEGRVDPRLMYAPNVDLYGNGKLQPLEGVDAAYLMKMKDIIDLLSLSFLYYDPSKNTDVNQTAYIKNTPKTYRNIALGALKKKASEEEPNTMLDFTDLRDYIVNYLTSDATIAQNQLDGTRWSSKSGTGYSQKYGMTNKKEFYDTHKDIVVADYFKNLADKIFRNVYGINLDVPEKLFTYGNNKLAEDTLVINFTSAHRCPAWDECLVRNACYARASEHGYKDLFSKNKNINMMWEGSKYDSRIMDALKAVIRSYLINYSKLAPVFNTNLMKKTRRAADAKNLLNQASVDNVYQAVNEGGANRATQNKMIEIIKSHEGFNQLSEEQLAIIKNPKYGILRAKYIRLNEEGDFIGQWLVDAIDEFAGELKKIGVAVTAYTCRHLNYNGVKNIIINASKSSIGSNPSDGTVANAIARRFYAVPEDFYNSLDETYAASSALVKYDAAGNPVNKPVAPTLISEGGETHIIPYPQPVYSDEAGQERKEGYYYYKCPCGRGKSDKTTTDPIKNRFNNVNVNAGEVGKSGINCYDCRVCYEPKSILTDKPIVVYVQVHSTEKELFDYQKQKDTGFSKEYQNTRQELGLNEEIFNVRDEEAEKEQAAYRQIAQNAIDSVNAHLAGLSQYGMMQEENIKNNFNNILKRINDVKF